MSTRSKEKILRGLIDSMLTVLLFALLVLPISFLGFGSYNNMTKGVAVLGESTESTIPVVVPSGKNVNKVTPPMRSGYIPEDELSTYKALETTESTSPNTILDLE